MIDNFISARVDLVEVRFWLFYCLDGEFGVGKVSGTMIWIGCLWLFGRNLVYIGLNVVRI